MISAPKFVFKTCFWQKSLFTKTSTV